MAKRKAQINFQVEQPMKMLYDEAKFSGHLATRFCAAGLLLMVEEPRTRVRALNRLRDWEERYEDASPEQIRAFVQGAEDAMQRGALGSPPARGAPAARKKAKRGRSA